MSAVIQMSILYADASGSARSPTGRSLAVKRSVTRRAVTTRWFRTAFLLGAVGLGPTALAANTTQSANLNASVAAGEEHVTRLRNLPTSAFLSVAVEIDGEAQVLLLDKANLGLAPTQRRPLFAGSTESSIQIGAKIPESGTYYLVIDNRRGTTPREFSLEVTATAPAASPAVSNDSPGGNSDKQQQFQAQMDKLEQKLRRYFVFDDLQFRLARCGTPNAYADHESVVICLEIGPLLSRLGDRDRAQDVFIFTLMHEIAHVWMRQWGYPFHDNEEVADEFATALLTLFNHGERARAAAKMFSELPSQQEYEFKKRKFDRHPLSVQRARNIHRWLEDPELLRRWQKIFLPHMQTEILEALRQNPRAWLDRQQLRQELALRSD